MYRNKSYRNYQQKSFNLVIESHVHHQHLPSDADPAGATGVVGVHATPEPHLQTQTHILLNGYSEFHNHGEI